MSEPLITHELLRSWNPCIPGYRRYCELFPNGETLPRAIDGLVADGHDDWGFWLFEKCREHKIYELFISGGYRNSGSRNSGSRNSGSWNSGSRNSGSRNSGSWNSGYQNSGDQNSGYQNSGSWNSGDQNSGSRNSGDQNSGSRNSGSWNSGSRNSGYFNSDMPTEIRVFGKSCLRSEWENSQIPAFLYFATTQWVGDSQMTDQEKIDNPKFYVAGGFLKTIPYKQAFQEAYAKASDDEKALLLKLPNFDADIFFEISGIRV